MPPISAVRHLPLFGVLVLALASPLTAQSDGRAPRVLQIPASTRAMALGDAYMMNARHADALFYHPALVADASGFGLDVQRWTGEGSAATASAAMAWLGGAVAVGLQTLQYGAPTGPVEAYPGGQDLLFDLGPAPTSERVATVGYARTLMGIDVGVSGKLVEQRIAGERQAVGAVDVGAATEVGPLVVGLTARNLGPAMDFADGPAPLPRRYTLGAGAYGRPTGPFDLGLTGAVTWNEDAWVPAAGVELGYWPIQGRTFVARAGVRRIPDGDASPFTFGFAFWGDDVVLEWAYQAFGGELNQASHRFGVRWR